jgi:hypothetical protein
VKDRPPYYFQLFRKDCRTSPVISEVGGCNAVPVWLCNHFHHHHLNLFSTPLSNHTAPFYKVSTDECVWQTPESYHLMDGLVLMSACTCCFLPSFPLESGRTGLFSWLVRGWLFVIRICKFPLALIGWVGFGANGGWVCDWSICHSLSLSCTSCSLDAEDTNDMNLLV